MNKIEYVSPELEITEVEYFSTATPWGGSDDLPFEEFTF